MTVFIQEEGVNVTQEERRAITNLVEMVLQEEGSCGEVSILLTGNERMQELNQKYRHHPSPTDVLSFSQDHPDLLGDIAISMEMVMEMAQEDSTSSLEALLTLVLHGLLHLFGFDHREDDEAREMEEREAYYRGRFILG